MLIKTRQKPPTVLGADQIQTNKTLAKVPIKFSDEAVFQALTSRNTPEEIEEWLKENPDAKTSVPKQWNIWRQKKDIGRVPAKVSYIELVLEKNSDDRINLSCNVYGHDLAFHLQQTPEGAVFEPTISVDGDIIPVDSNGTPIPPDAEDNYLMQLAVRLRKQGERTFWSVEPVNQRGQGAVVDRNPRAVTLPDGKIVTRTGWDLNKGSLPGLQSLIIGALNSKNLSPVIADLLGMMEISNETQGGASAMNSALARIEPSSTFSSDKLSELSEDETPTESGEQLQEGEQSPPSIEGEPAV